LRRVLHRAAEHGRRRRVRGAGPADPPVMTQAPQAASAAPILTVSDLAVSFATDQGVVQAVDGVSFDLRPGEILAVVGESGCGKSVTAMTLLGLTRSPNARFEGTATYKGTELVG